LVVPDITRGTGNFNLALGIAVSIGTALSTSLAGCVMDHFGRNRVWGLPPLAVCGLALLWLLLPERGLSVKQLPITSGAVPAVP
jgi:hypothetical protein